MRDMDDKVLRAGRATSPCCRASSRRPMRCPTRTGATAFRSAASPRSTPTQGGIVSAGGVGFDISCGVRSLLTGLAARRRRAGQGARSPTSCPGPSRPGVGAPADPPHAERDGRDARGRRALGASSSGYGEAADLERIEEHGCMPDARPRGRLRQGQAAAARRDGHARLGQPLPRGPGGRRRSSTPSRRPLRARRRGRRGDDPLRFARPRPPDRHRVPARDGARRGAARHRLPDRELACAPINSDDRPALSRRDARRHQLRARQPADHRAIWRARVFAGSSRRASSRCSSTSRTTPARSRSTRRRRSGASSTCTARARRAPSARAIPTCPRRLRAVRPAGPDRRHHGHRVLRAGRHRGERESRLQLGRATAPAAA